MFELVPSACMRAYFEELHFEFTDFQKATLIWNAPNKSWKERLEALCELAETTEDADIRQQIHERMSFEQKKWETFLNNDSGRYIYVVEDKKNLESCGFFASYGIAFQYAIKYIEEYKTICAVKKQLIVQCESDEIVRNTGRTNPYVEIGYTQPEFESYRGVAVSQVTLDKNGEIREVHSNELTKSEEEVVDSFRPDRFEFAFMKIPFDMQVGATVKDLATGNYYVLAQGKKEWDEYLQRIEENGWYVDYSDIQVIVYELTETGHWSHMHINPLYLDYEFPPYIEGDEVRSSLRRAMGAFGDYLHYMDCGKTKYADGEMVLKYAREYAETVRKKDCWYRRVQEAKKPEDMMF